MILKGVTFPLSGSSFINNLQLPSYIELFRILYFFLFFFKRSI